MDNSALLNQSAIYIGENGQPWNESLRSPPKQFTFVIAGNGGTEKVFYNHNYLRILSITATAGITLRFGDSGTPTDIIGAGIGYELPFIVGNTTIRNDSGAPITITISVAIGRIYDDRLNVSGTVNIANTKAAPLYVSAPISSFQASAGTVGTGAASLINTATCVRFIVQNSGTTNLYIGDSGLNATFNGIWLPPNASLEVTDAAGLDYRIISDAVGGAYKFMRWFS